MHVVVYYLVRSRMKLNHVRGLAVIEMQANVFFGCLNQCLTAETPSSCVFLYQCLILDTMFNNVIR